MARGITISILILMILLIGSTFVSAYIRFFLSKTVDTPKYLYERMIKIFGKGEGRVFVDLGSGNFDLLFSVEKAGFKVVGVEISPFLVILGKIKKLFKRSKGIIKQKNIFNVYLKEFDLIFINQQDSNLHDLFRKIKSECSEDTEIYLFNKAFVGLEPEQSFKLDEKYRLNKYIGKQFKDE